MPITVEVRGADNTGIPIAGGLSGSTFFDVSISGTGVPLPLHAAVGFGNSPEGDNRGAGPHLLVELEVLVLNPGGTFFNDPTTGDPGGVYSPDPAFWGANIANDLVDPPASAAVFSLQPDGSTLLDSSFVPVIPLPAPDLMGLALFGVLGVVKVMRWRSAA